MNPIEAVDKYVLTGSCHGYDRVPGLTSSYRSNVLRSFLRDITCNQLYPGRFLDIACGKGLVADYVDKHTSLEVVRADISEIGLQQTTGQRVRASATELAFADGSFSAVHMKDALVHIDDHAKLLSELHRVLVPSGRLLLVSEERFVPTFSFTDKGKEEVTLVRTMNEYVEIADFFANNPEDKKIGPPYFKIETAKVIETAQRIGFDVSKLHYWKPHGWEKEWHGYPVSRFVLNLIRRHKV